MKTRAVVIAMITADIALWVALVLSYPWLIWIVAALGVWMLAVAFGSNGGSQ